MLQSFRGFVLEPSGLHALAHLNEICAAERDFLTEDANGFLLPVGIVHVDPKTRAVLIELPHEAETGANRVWVESTKLDEPIEVFA